jgi:beta-phosphoglucomutase
MQWIHEFQLFLFDFDGLLVNSEEIHFLAYKQMCGNHGFHLDWDFNRYCQAAHYEAHFLEDQIYEKFPALKVKEPDWKVLYAEKKSNMISLLKQGAAHLMPGVERLLMALEEAKIKRCVVTHSPNELVNIVKEQHQALSSIPYWVTREQYSHPKPHPECYLKAINLYADKGDKVIGFEDTPRGLRALMETTAKPVLVCRADYPEIPYFKKMGAIHYRSIDSISERLI